MSAVAKRYAAALLASAREAGVLDPVGEDLAGLLRLLDTSEEFAGFVAHPLIRDEDRDACLDKLFAGKATPVTLNFLHLLVQRERLADLPSIVQQAMEMWREEKGILQVGVVSAQELLKSQQDELVRKLAARTGKTIELTCRVDPGLIGGFRLHFGGLVEDYSLARKLETFKRNVINA